MKLNPSYEARRVRRKVYLSSMTGLSDYWFFICGMRVTKRQVKEVLARKARVFKLSPTRRYYVEYHSHYVKIGCQKFYLTRVRKLLSLFP